MIWPKDIAELFQGHITLPYYQGYSVKTGKLLHSIYPVVLITGTSDDQESEHVSESGLQLMIIFIFIINDSADCCFDQLINCFAYKMCKYWEKMLIRIPQTPKWCPLSNQQTRTDSLIYYRKWQRKAAQTKKSADVWHFCLKNDWNDWSIIKKHQLIDELTGCCSTCWNGFQDIKISVASVKIVITMTNVVYKKRCSDVWRTMVHYIIIITKSLSV